jgi:hypothetical protein
MTTYHQADDQKRVELLKLWGGTTTAQRTPWEQAIETGLNEGWYQIQFGEALQVERRPDKLAVTIRSGANLAEQSCLLADFIIDATGLDANFTQNPLLADLAETYQLPQNSMGQLNVDDDFVVTGLENGSGRVYASGVTTLGGPFAPVDSFTGLQYAAQCSIASLLSLDAPGLQPLTPTRSIQQWLRWAWDRQP